MRALATLFVVAILPLPARADDGKAACLAAHGDAQLLRKKHALKEATAKLRVCARETCPALAQKDCTRWLSEVEAEQPTILVVATDESGKETLAVRVLEGETILAEKLDGTAIALDPGEHALRFERPGGKAVERHIVLREGEKARRVEVSFGPPAAPATTLATPRPNDTPRTISPAAWVFGAVGVAALGSFTYFALSGRSRESNLSSSCAPRCSDDEIDGVRTRYLVADISFGVSVVSLGLATYFALTGKSEPRAAEVSVRPLNGGAFLGLGARF